ncbi:MAG: VCBS repeat-containing protein [Candidatus Magnetomorum sp.]|nr:VCBS repeat-containing protein [Candidatus Magnetomorum sp.]
MSDTTSLKQNLVILIISLLIYCGLIQSALAEHFTLSANSYASMVFYGDIFTFDNVNSQEGDEIAVFDPQGILCGHFVSTAQTSGMFMITVYGDDTDMAGDQGADYGDTLSFIVWDDSVQREISLTHTMYIQKEVFGTSSIETVPPQYMGDNVYRGMGIAALSETPPTISTSITDQTTIIDYPISIPFQLTDNEGGQIQLSVASCLTSLVTPENISFTGTNITRNATSYTINTMPSTPETMTMTIQPLSGQSGEAMLTLTIDDSGTIVEKAFAFSVLSPFTEDENILLPGGMFCSAAFGDYDNDGDLDIVNTAYLGEGRGSAKVYKNTSGSFSEDTGITLPEVSYGSVVFGDYDNDNDLDILLTGYDSDSMAHVAKVYQNSGGSFSEASNISLTGVEVGSSAFGDYDNDGDLDILISGNSANGKIAKVYQNAEGSFSEASNITLTGVEFSSAAFGDYDNDSDLDILITGNSDNGFLAKVYRNTGGVFSEDSVLNLTGVNMGSSAFGDYDNDGDLDILISGYSDSGKIAKVYQNTGGHFSENTNIILTGVSEGSSVFGDYDNDGDLDILISGYSDSTQIAKVYRNTGGSFSEDTGINLSVGYDISSSAFGDYDNDGDLDILLTGGLLKIYRNNYNMPGTAPSAPNHLTSVVTDNHILLSWSAGSDPETISPSGLNYNLQIGSQPGGCDILSSMSLPLSNNVRLIPARGMFQTLTTTINPLNDGTYYWRVQTLDTSFVGSPFSDEYSFTIVPPFSEVNNTVLQGVNWGTGDFLDYDNDGDLDILITGDSDNGKIAKIYRNTAGNFSEATDITLTGVGGSSTAFGDYDNDGDIDLLLTGNSGNGYIARVYQNTGGSFSENIGITLTGVEGSSVAFGDYDNDGDLDILITGESDNGPMARIYQNTGGSFSEDTNITLTGVEYSSAAFGDYDNDSDLDILITGYNGSEDIAKVFRNTGGNFSEDSGISITGVDDGFITFADYDNDGDLDILISGDSSSGLIARMYLNSSGSFSEAAGISLTGVALSSHAFGDYDSDGDLDILLTGAIDDDHLITKVYRNTDGSFSEDIGINLIGLADSSAAFGDYDNDGDLDILITGYDSSDELRSILYKNNHDIPNTSPSAPESLTSVVTGNQVYLSWAAASDAETLSATGLNYNLSIGSSPGTCDILSPMSLPLSSGYRLIPSKGMFQNLSATVNYLNEGTYYWSVQAIDTAFAGSPFSSEYSFTVNVPPDFSLISSYTTVENVSMAIAFSITDANSCGLSLTFHSSNPTLIPMENISYTCHSGNYTLTVVPASDQHGTAAITITAEDSGDLTASTSFDLTVTEINDPPIISFIENQTTFFSGVNNGSVAFADYDNDADLDILITGNGTAKIYQNSGGNFSEYTGISISGVSNSSTAFGDYDNDGDLDILITGYSGTNVARLYQNTEGSFSEVTGITLQGGADGSCAFGDYDNDGDLDILITGNKIAKIYKNTGGSFSEDTRVDIPGVEYSAAAFGDYDNDGDLDIVITGEADSGYSAKIYQNTTGYFTENTDISLAGVYAGSAIFGDYDNDADLDLLITGETGSNQVAELYQNTGSGFTKNTQISLKGVRYSAAAFGDYDNDGDLDILITGYNTNGYIASLYQNTGNDFIENTDVSLTPVCESATAFGDYDNDGDLDIIMCGNTGSGNICKLYQNNTPVSNTSPSAPSHLTSLVEGESVLLSWSSGSDAQTMSPTGLNYNIKMGSSPGACDISAPMSLTAGDRQIAEKGLIQNLTATVQINAPGTYYWRIQTIDTALSGSSFSDEYSFTVVDVRPIPGNNGLISSSTLNPFESAPVFNWSAASDAESFTSDLAYRIYISTVSYGTNIGAWESFATAASNWMANTNTCTIQNLNASTSYYCVVVVRDTSFNKAIYAPLYICPYHEMSDTNFPNVIYSAGTFGDYDNDGDLDIIITGSDYYFNLSTRAYQNTNGSFSEDTGMGLAGVVYGTLTFGDYDNDNDLDLLITGSSYTGRNTTLYQNTGGTFTQDAANTFPDVYLGSQAFGDYDNDGDLDVLITGESDSGYLAKLYRNTDTIFSEDTGNILTGVKNSSCVFGDYDNDGDLDILIAGEDTNGPVAILYQNTNGVFSEDTGNILTAATMGTATFGDYDNDGDLDILITSSTATVVIAMVYENTDGAFSEASGISLTGAAGRSSFGDYDNDGDLDILITGVVEGSEKVTRLYPNIDKHFSDDAFIALKGITGSASFGDCDNDGDLDLLFIGEGNNEYIAAVYQNDLNIPNTVPSAPMHLSAQTTDSEVHLSWSAASDAETISPTGLNYNLKIGSTPGTFDSVSPISLDNGHRLIPARGMIQNLTSTINNLSNGIYYWSVQAIDTAFAGSKFSTESRFIIGTPPMISPISDQTVQANTTIHDIAFTVTNTDAAPCSLTLVFESSNTTVVPVENIQTICQEDHYTVSVQPDNNHIGTSTIVITLLDHVGVLASTAFDVTSTNTPPSFIEASPVQISMDEDAFPQAFALTLHATDPDNDVLSWQINAQATHGTASVSGTGFEKNISYTPETNYYGADHFDIQIDDGHNHTAAITIQLSIQSINDTPVINQNTGITVTEGASQSIGSPQLQTTDPDHQPQNLIYTYVSNTPDSHGNLYKDQNLLQMNDTFTQADIDNNLISYTHAGGEQNALTIGLKVSDGFIELPAFDLTVTILPVNDPPVLLNNTSLTLNEGSQKIIDSNMLLSLDDDNTAQELTYVVSLLPVHGIIYKNGLSLSDNQFTQQDIFNSHIVYEHDGSETTSDSFTFIVSDNMGGMTTQTTFSIQVQPVNDAPDISAISDLSVMEDQSIPIRTFQIVDAETLPEHLSLSGHSSNQSLIPDNQIVISGTGQNRQIQLTVLPDQFGTANIVITLTDAGGLSDTSQFQLVVQSVDDAPVVNQVISDQTLDEDSDTRIISLINAFNDIDNDNSEITFQVTQNTNPSIVQALVAANELKITPQPDQNGNAQLVITATSNGKAISQRIQLTISPVNDAPDASDTSVFLNEDSTIISNLLAVDRDMDNLTYTVDTSPQHGIVFVMASNGSYQYTPDLNTNGHDSFTWHASDGHLNSETATISIQISPVNDPPVISQSSHEGNENIVHWFTASDFFTHFTDIDDDNLYEIQITHLPDNGTLRLNETPIAENTIISTAGIAELNYLPALDWGGTTAYTWLAFDGTDWSISPAMIVMAIEADPVSISTIIKSGMEDQFLEFDASDLQNFTLNSTSFIKAVTLPPHGTLLFDSQKTTPDHEFSGTPLYEGQEIHIETLLAGELAFLPDTHFNGFTSMLWRASKNDVWSDDELVKLTILPVNDPPLVQDFQKFIVEDTLVTFASSDFKYKFTDIDGDQMQYIRFSGMQSPESGTITANQVPITWNQEIALMDIPGISYMPAPDQTESQMIYWQASDGNIWSENTASCAIYITPVDDPPYVLNPLENQVANEDDLPISMDIKDVFNDIDNDPNEMTFQIIENTNLALVTGTITGTTMTLVIEKDQWGETLLTIQAISNDKTAQNSFTLTINAIDDAPSVSQPLTPLMIVQEDSAELHIDLNPVFTDIDNDDADIMISVFHNSRPDIIEVNIQDHLMSLHLLPDQNGLSEITLLAQSGASSITHRFSVEILPVDDPPVVAMSIPDIETFEDAPPESIDLSPVFFDIDQTDGIIVKQIYHNSNPSLLKTDLNEDQLFISYLPDQFGDAVIVIMGQSSGQWVTTQFQVHVTSVNDAPSASSLTFETKEDQPLTGTLKGVDLENDPLTFHLNSTAEKGRVTITNTQTGEFLYRPFANASGTDQFTFSVKDQADTSNITLVSLTIAPVNDPPVNTQLPVIIGLPHVGHVLTTDTGAWHDNIDQNPGSITFAYQWLRADDMSGTNWIVMEQFTQNDYTAIIDDHKKYVQVKITATDDGEGLPISQTATAFSDWIQISNTAPDFTESAPYSLVIDEDTSGEIQLHATDAENDAITWTIPSQPAMGTATISNDLIHYQPKPNVNGSDTFDIRISDFLGDTNTRALNIIIQPVNDPPVISQSSHEGNENIVHWFTASDFFTHFTDIDDDNLYEIQITHLPDNGTLRLNETPIAENTIISTAGIAELNYLPALDWGGTTAYTWLAFDGTDWSISPAMIVMAIEADPVSISTIIKSGMEDQFLEFDASDLQNFTLNSTSFIKAVTLPPHGTLLFDSQKTTPDHEFSGTPLYEGQEIHIETLLAGELAFLPDTHFNGFTSMLWRASKNDVWSDDELVKLTILPVNDPPLVQDFQKFIVEDTLVTFASSDFKYKFTDIDGDQMQYIRFSGMQSPESGTITANQVPITWNQEIALMDIPGISYMPAPDQTESQMIYWQASDGRIWSENTASCAIHITPVNDPPVVAMCINDITAFEDATPESIDLSQVFSDIDQIDPIVKQVYRNSNPSLLTTDISGDQLVISYLPDQSGDAVIVIMGQSSGQWVTTQFRVHVKPVNDPPTASSLTFEIKEDQSLRNHN